MSGGHHHFALISGDSVLCDGGGVPDTANTLRHHGGSVEAHTPPESNSGASLGNGVPFNTLKGLGLCCSLRFVAAHSLGDPRACPRSLGMYRAESATGVGFHGAQEREKKGTPPGFLT